MSDDKRQRVIEKIRGLFAKTEGRGATVEEAATAAAKAQELLTNYALSLEDLEVKDEGAYVRATVSFNCWQEHVRTHHVLLHQVARFNFCKAIALRGAKSSWLIGRAEHIEVVTWLYQHLANEFRRLEKGIRPPYYTTSWQRQFWYGCMRTIVDRLSEKRREMEAEIETGARVTALVAVTKGALEKSTYELVGKTWSVGSHGPRSFGSAYTQGREAARGINLNPPLPSSGCEPRALR